MKKLLNILLAVLILVPLVGTFERTEVSAQETACGLDFEVAYINDDGTFVSESCHSDFNSAKSKMKEMGGDRVVRHYASLSDSKIIAMNSGVAYSYPGRDNSKTLNIYQHVSDHSKYYKTTYISNHYEMTYHDTERYFVSNGKGLGMIQVSINGFDGYTDLECTDLVPSKFLDRNLNIVLGGNDLYSNEQPFEVRVQRNYYEAVRNGNYTDLVYHSFRAYPSDGLNPTHDKYTIGPASKEMKTGVKYYSNDGHTFYDNPSMQGKAISFYPYYQYLPLRSKTNISAETLNKFISRYSGSIMIDKGQNFIDAQNNYGINALTLFAMACHESGYGRSAIAKAKNNLFGWNAVDSSPGQSATTFNSVEHCISEHAGVNLRGFIDITDGRFFSSSLGNKGSGLNLKYASDPYWGMGIASLAYQIDKFQNNYDGNLSDYEVYDLALINTFDVEVKAEANAASKTLYTTQYGPYYQKDFVVITLDEGNEFTKIQSTNAIDENGNIKTHRTPVTVGDVNPISTYDYERSVAYIRSDYLTKLNVVKVEEEKPDMPSESMAMVNNLSIDENTLHIEGLGLIKGMNFTNPANIEHYVVLKNIEDYKEVSAYPCKNVEAEGIDFNDGYIYKYIGFEVDIPLSSIEEGSYVFDIRTINKDQKFENRLMSTDTAYTNMNVKTADKNYHLASNRNYSYRIELDIESLPELIDYTAINKPSSKVSLFAFDSSNLSINENGIFQLYGQAMIYYLDYAKEEDVKYTMYLIEDKDNFKVVPLSTKASDFDYQSLLESSFKMDYICFEGETDLSDLSAGTYKMLLKIENGSYIDFIEMTNRSFASTPSKTVGDTTYSILTNSIRNRLQLEVKK
ncbi:MAG: glucosaminidase domain-containing protein [Erysipelotrichaceae bacterium]|nr:glucosaminidase domain-containing protein [Erysipelotrichaceae bacterium]